MLNDIKNWFAHSETIFWTRLQFAAGIVWAVLSVTDMSPLLSPKWFAIWGIVNGIIGEYLRRRNTTTVSMMVPSETGPTGLVKVTTLVTNPITDVG